MISTFFKSLPPSRQNAIAYSTTTFAISMMNSIFFLYYVDLFLNVYKLEEWHFNISQLIFLVWNAINDPLFGWIQDNSAPLIGRRLGPIYYVGPVYALSFLAPWFPLWNIESSQTAKMLHFLFSLCLYDGLFTYVALSQCSLFAEMSLGERDRAQVMQYDRIASIIGCSTTFWSYLFWHGDDLFQFRCFCILLSLLSACGFYFTATHVSLSTATTTTTTASSSSSSTTTHLASNSNGSDAGASSETEGRRPRTAAAAAAEVSFRASISASLLSLWSFCRQIFANNNFLMFVSMNFLQVFNTNFNSNFYSIFESTLAGAQSTSSFAKFIRSILFASSSVLPQCITILLTPFVVKYGSYFIIKYLIVLKLALGFALLLLTNVVNTTHPTAAVVWVILLYMTLNRSFADSTFSLFNISVSDMIDQDFVAHKRDQPMSSMFFGVNALITKPAQSFAPMVVVAILARSGYNHRNKSSSSSVAGANNDQVRSTMIQLLWLIPSACALVQLLLWSRYDLHSDKLQKVKHDRKQRGRVEDGGVRQSVVIDGSSSTAPRRLSDHDGDEHDDDDDDDNAALCPDARVVQTTLASASALHDFEYDEDTTFDGAEQRKRRI